MYIAEIQNGNFKTEIHGLQNKLKSGGVVKGINCIDSFSFSMLPNNPGFDLLCDFQTLVTVWNTNKNRYDFQGRVLCSAPAMDESGKITKEATCESFFGFLCDSVQKYSEEKNWTVKGLLQHIIDTHNSQVEDYKKFTIGEVSDDLDPNDNLYVGIQRENTWKTIEEKLLNKRGGEIRFRVVDGVLYLDYLKKIGATRTTPIALSKNMKAIRKESDPSAYITRLIPLGAKLTKEVTSTDEEGNETVETVETEERLTIEGVNNGIEYIDDTTAIEVYGIHVGYIEFDDASDSANLLRKGQEWLAENNKVQVKYSITALDLSLLGLDIDDFNVHDYHPIVNPLLGIDDTARIIKKNIDICDEVKSTIEVGDNFKTLSEIQREQANKISGVADNVTKIENTTNELKDKVTNVEKKVNQIEGIDGVYFYVKYSQYADGHEMTDAPDENTVYMGTCSTSETTAPTDYTKYTWVKIKGADGTSGTPGQAGEDGKSQYFHVKYSDDGKTFTSNDGETLGDWMGTCVTETEADPTSFTAYTWKKIVGEDGQNGIDGADGKDGTSAYFYVKFSANANGDPMTETPQDDTKYMGVCSSTSETAPTDPNAYDWTQCRGNDGTNGTPGATGADGKTQYLHIKYSDDGKTFTGNMLPTDISGWESGYYTTGHVTQKNRIVSPLIPVTAGAAYKVYLGTAWKYGIARYTGENGETYKTSASYSYIVDNFSFTAGSDETFVRISIISPDTSATFATFEEAFASGEIVPAMYPADEARGEDLGAYIGTFVDFVEADSDNFDDYTWKKFTEDVDEELADIRQTVEERYTSAINTAESIILSALESYVQTSNYEEFKQTVETQFEVMAGEIEMNFTTTTEQITNVDGTVQSEFNKLYKYIKFSGETAITIGSGNSAITLEIDNETGIVFKKNGVQFGLWDGENFYTGNIVVGVNERAQFGNFAFVPRTDGSLSFLKVGG